MALERFEDTHAWRKGRELTKALYEVTSGGSFSRDRSLCDQIRRASVSIMSNIAEGFERDGNREFIQFLTLRRAPQAKSGHNCTSPWTQITLRRRISIASPALRSKSRALSPALSGIFARPSTAAASSNAATASLKRPPLGTLNFEPGTGAQRPWPDHNHDSLSRTRSRSGRRRGSTS